MKVNMLFIRTKTIKYLKYLLVVIVFLCVVESFASSILFNNTSYVHRQNYSCNLLKTKVKIRKNKSFAEQVANKNNTIFEIRHIVDLKQETVLMPSNCVLKFAGGQIKNGVIVGDDTKIVSGERTILYNVQLIGTWINEDSYVSWFKTDESNKYNLLRSAFNLGRTVCFTPNANYIVQTPTSINDLISPKYHKIIGNSATIIVLGGGEQHNLFYIGENDYFDLEVENLNITGVGNYSVNKGDLWMYNNIPNAFFTSNVIGFHIVGRGNFSIKNCNFSNLLYGIRIDETEKKLTNRNFYMYGCSSDETCIMPVMIHHVNNTIIKNCKMTCATSTGLNHHLYLADCIDSLIVEDCILYGGTGDPLDIYHSHCNKQRIINNRIIANDYSAIVLDDIDGDVHIEKCYLYATGRGCLYAYDCRGNIICDHIFFETPVSDITADNYVIHSPYSETQLWVQLDSCQIKTNKLHSAVSSVLSLDILNCRMLFYTGSSVTRPTSKVVYNIRDSYIECPNFNKYSTLFDVRTPNSIVKLSNTEINRGDEEGDWLMFVDVPYTLSIENCICNNVKTIIQKKDINAKTSILHSKNIQTKSNNKTIE